MINRIFQNNIPQMPIYFTTISSEHIQEGVSRPEGLFAGKLIEDCGLKGYRIGGAEVSEKHAGFIINRGGATAKDVLLLIDHIKETVLNKFGVSLECEIKYVD